MRAWRPSFAPQSRFEDSAVGSYILAACDGRVLVLDADALSRRMSASRESLYAA